ncbi:cadherin domain protein [Dictyocaulus viviparus]|uniref:Cadherin domain protein n=1 Tax=Dictyocaulus viviparus TaxID=29172 RepID=A0A0D8XS39_DICVI|nr:cadherin domain protein [Dictyocaulus viviparus]
MAIRIILSSSTLNYQKFAGDVLLRRPLKESDPDDVRISIIASDQGSPRKSTVCYVQVKIASGTSAVKLVEPFERNIRVPNDCQTSCQLEELNITGVAKWHIQSNVVSVRDYLFDAKKINDVSNHFMIVKRKLYMTSRPRLPSPWVLSLILSDRHERQKHVTIRIVESNSIMPTKPIKLSPLLPIGSKVTSLASKSKPSDDTFYYVPINQMNMAIEKIRMKIVDDRHLSFLEKNDHSSLFELDESNGDVYLIKKIRHLIGQQINMSYKEIDGRTFKTEEKMINFEVESGFIDVPYFDREILYITVSETVAFVLERSTEREKVHTDLDRAHVLSEIYANATVITTVNATTQFASPLYRFLEISNQFAIDQYSGEVSVIENLHWNETALLTSRFQAPYHLVVLASLGEVKSRVLLVVHVEDVNDNHPKILSSNEVTVFTGNSHIIHYVVATDDDYGSNATIGYEIISDPSNCFDIDPNSGALSMLRRPSSTESTIVVRASDNGSPSLFVDQTLKIRLPHVTHNWKYFAEDELVVELTDATPVGTVIRTIGLDVFGSSSVIFPILFHLFTSRLAPQNGTTSSARKFSFISRKRFADGTALFLVAVLSFFPFCSICSHHALHHKTGQRHLQEKAFIKILKCECASLRLLFYFKEAFRRRHCVGEATVQLSPSSSDFGIDDSGRITLLTSLIPGSYHLSVVAKTPAGNIDFLSMVIRVTSSKTAEPRISSASCGSITVPENRSLENFKQIVALNTSKNSRFSIQGSNKYFNIDPLSGRLSSVALDREQQSEHLLVINVTDGYMTDSCSVQITVSDVNDNAPQFSTSTPEMIAINDSVRLGDVVYRFTASDADIGSNARILFELVEDSSNIFDLDPESGELFIMRELSDTKKDWMVRVKVYDKGRPSLGVDRLLRIQNSRSVVDKTDIVPSFLRQKYVTSVDEGLTPGKIVSKVSLSSRDSRITYSIVEGNTDSAFEIDDDGVVRTAQELDYEIKESYNLKIIATGASPHQIHTRMFIDVNNVNDNPPVFRPQSKRKVLETLPIGSYITTVTANDADNASAIEYSLDTNEKRFVIDRFTGVVHLAANLDYETLQEIKVDVMANDGNFTAVTSFIVVVMDVNDNAPEFQQRSVSIEIPHYTAMNNLIAKLFAFDRDSGENGRVSYSLADDYGIFHLDSNDGTLTMSSSVLSDSEFLLTVTASDHGFPMMSSVIPVHIKITQNELQQRPEFAHSSYEFSVTESMVRHVVFGNVSVDDINPYFYRIMDPIMSEIFDIDRLGRTLTMTSSVLSDSEFLLTVTASDHGFPMMSSVIPVHIKITQNELQQRPEFAHSSYEFSVTESMVRHVVFGNVSVDDINPYFYRIMDPIMSEIFDIDRLGRFTLKKTLDKETQELYSFTIDVGSQPLIYNENSTASVTIRVLDVNDNAPLFHDDGNPVIISDALRNGDVLRILKATDADAGENGRVSYRIVSGDDYNIFTIDSDNGVLMFNQWNDEQLIRHIDGKWTVYVEARDHGTNQKASILALNIVIELKSWSGTAPFFVVPSYKVVVPENSSPDESTIFTAKATNRIGLPLNTVRYQLKDNDKIFAIHSTNGSIRLRHKLDYETKASYKMLLIASDGNLRSSIVSLEIIVLPVDEFPPVFTQSRYTFQANGLDLASYNSSQRNT